MKQLSNYTWRRNRPELLKIIDRDYLDNPDQPLSQVYERIIRDFPKLGISADQLQESLDRHYDKIGADSASYRLARKKLVLERRALDKRARSDA